MRCAVRMRLVRRMVWPRRGAGCRVLFLPLMGKLVGVHPKLVAVIRRAARLSPVPFKVLECLRSVERQRALVNPS